MINDLHIIKSSASVLDALEKLNNLSGREMTLLVVDDSFKLQGTLTDGDIRRALLNGAKLNSLVKSAMHTTFRAINAEKSDIVHEIRKYRDVGINLLPVIDNCGILTDIINLTQTSTILPVDAVLMAGGRGERLRPLTDSMPKPLLEVGGKAIIDYNVEALAKCGIKNITVTTRYLADMINAHFSKPIRGITVKTIKEDYPLGTIGSLALVPDLKAEATILMNSDLLTSISFEDLYLHHKATNADITVATIPYVVSVPYAIMDVDGSRVNAICEKPTYTYYANAGIYIINNRLLSTINKGERLDAPDFITQSISRGHSVSYFPISGTWIDIGSPADYRQACELMNNHKQLAR